MKATKIIFWFVLSFIVIDFLSYAGSSLQHIQEGGYQSIAWICKMSNILLCLTVGLLFYRLQVHFNKMGYLDLKCASNLQLLGVLCLSIAVIAAVQNAGSLGAQYPKELSTPMLLNGLARAFVGHLLVKSPLQILFGLFLFLFADFVKKASILKNENEAFI